MNELNNIHTYCLKGAFLQSLSNAEKNKIKNTTNDMQKRSSQACKILRISHWFATVTIFKQQLKKAEEVERHEKNSEEFIQWRQSHEPWVFVVCFCLIPVENKNKTNNRTSKKCVKKYLKRKNNFQKIAILQWNDYEAEFK